MSLRATLFTTFPQLHFPPMSNSLVYAEAAVQYTHFAYVTHPVLRSHADCTEGYNKNLFSMAK